MILDTPIRVRLTRIDSNHDNLRTVAIDGWLHTKLEVGSHILLLAEPLDGAFAVRYVRTTEIESIEGDNYRTANSTYRIEEI